MTNVIDTTAHETETPDTKSSVLDTAAGIANMVVRNLPSAKNAAIALGVGLFGAAVTTYAVKNHTPEEQ